MAKKKSTIDKLREQIDTVDESLTTLSDLIDDVEQELVEAKSTD